MTQIVELHDDSYLTIHRYKWGRGFTYKIDNNRVTCPKTLSRIKKLVIPPMWETVRISENANTHIQANGRDAKDRLQYVYHELYELQRQQEKFKKLALFGEQIPGIRKLCVSHLEAKKWTRERVLALMVLILDNTGIRIGNKQYTKRNDTYGLSTLRRKHLEVDDGTVLFQYRGKGNKEREVSIEDQFLTSHITKSAELPGYQIFRYKDEEGRWCDIDSQDVNDFIHSLMGSEFTSKYFRTWVASRLAVEFYDEALQKKNQNSRRSLLGIICRLVSSELGHTPTTCKNYYIHPKIIENIKRQSVPLGLGSTDQGFTTKLSKAEEYLLDVIQE